MYMHVDDTVQSLVNGFTFFLLIYRWCSHAKVWCSVSAEAGMEKTASE